MKKLRNVPDAIQRPPGSVSVAKRPMINEPLRFTMSVPQGKVWPNVLAIQPETPHRARLPNPPPTNIQSAFHINPTLPRPVALAGVISTEEHQAVFSQIETANPIAEPILPPWLA